MPTETSSDELYLEILLTPMRECANYRPAFGRQSDSGVTLAEFHELYGADPLYRWVGLDSDLMYAAHKAAGGMTSIYRQLGIGSERLLRAIVKNEFSLTDEQLAWSYEYSKDDGTQGIHTLDLRIDESHISDVAAQSRLREWLVRVGTDLGINQANVDAFRGAVFEVRQGYKSADSKRQNADIRFGIHARNEDYLPVVGILSTQASETVCNRYRTNKLLVLLGTFGDDTESTFAFFQNVIGFDLVGFFTRNSPKLRVEFTKVLKALLTPD